MTVESQQPVLRNLQVARAFAATSVVVLHIVSGAKEHSVPLPLLSLTGNWGSSGVDLFFVISGFIMVYMQERRPRSAGVFLMDRLVRIAPLYWLFTATMVSLLVLASAFVRSPAPDVEHVVASVFFLSRPLLGLDPALYVGWTLEYEMLFYVVFAGAVFSLPGRLLLVGLAVSLGGLIVLDVLPPLVVEFLFGAGIAKIKPFISPRAGLWLLAIGATALFASAGQALPIEHRWFYWGVPSTLIVLGCVAAPQLKAGRLTQLGDSSYSLYLSHLFVVSTSLKLYTAIPGEIWAFMTIAAAIALGAFIHRFIEMPMSEWIKATISARKQSLIGQVPG